MELVFAPAHGEFDPHPLFGRLNGNLTIFVQQKQVGGMFENLTDRLERSFKLLKGQGQIQP